MSLVSLEARRRTAGAGWELLSTMKPRLPEDADRRRSAAASWPSTAVWRSTPPSGERWSCPSYTKLLNVARLCCVIALATTMCSLPGPAAPTDVQRAPACGQSHPPRRCLSRSLPEPRPAYGCTSGGLGCRHPIPPSRRVGLHRLQRAPPRPFPFDANLGTNLTSLVLRPATLCSRRLHAMARQHGRSSASVCGHATHKQRQRARKDFCCCTSRWVTHSIAGYGSATLIRRPALR